LNVSQSFSFENSAEGGSDFGGKINPEGLSYEDEKEEE